MSIKPQFENYRYIGEICRLQGQSVVETRLAGNEIENVLSVHAKVIPGECVCADGETQYGGRVLIIALYEGANKKLCRVERGVEFFHKAEGGQVNPSCFAKALLRSENVTWRREGAGLYISVVVGAEIAVFGGRQIEYLSGGENLIVKKEKMVVRKTLSVSGETEGEDEFDCDYVGDVLLHSQTAIARVTSANNGNVELEGELILSLCILTKEDGVGSYERVIPFHMQIPCDEAYGDVSASANVFVKETRLTATTDEEKGNSKVVFSYTLAATCFLHLKDEIEMVSDAFSTKAETELKSRKEGGRYLVNQIKHTERVSGAAMLSPNVEGEYVLQAVLLPRAETTIKKVENGVEVDGVVHADVILLGTDGGHRRATLSLPFSFPIQSATGDVEGLDCVVCGLSVRRNKKGETEADATLKICARAYQQCHWEYVYEVKEGELYPEETSAFSVFIPSEGEDLWQTAKRLCCDPDGLEKDNPQLQFPLKEGERIFIYRQIT